MESREIKTSRRLASQSFIRLGHRFVVGAQRIGIPSPAIVRAPGCARRPNHSQGERQIRVSPVDVAPLKNKSGVCFSGPPAIAPRTEHDSGERHTLLPHFEACLQSVLKEAADLHRGKPEPARCKQDILRRVPGFEGYIKNRTVAVFARTPPEHTADRHRGLGVSQQLGIIEGTVNVLNPVSEPFQPDRAILGELHAIHAPTQLGCRSEIHQMHLQGEKAAAGWH